MTPISVCQIFVGVSIFGMLFMIVRKLPLIASFRSRSVKEEKKISFLLKNKFNEGEMRVKGKIHQWGEKRAHQLRVWVLKIDNILTLYLQKAREQKKHIERIRLYRRKNKQEPGLEISEIKKDKPVNKIQHRVKAETKNQSKSKNRTIIKGRRLKRRGAK